MKVIKYSLAIIAIISVSAYTMTNNETSQFQVKMHVNETCDIGTGSSPDIDFGTVSRTTQNVQATGNLNVSCTNGTPYNIALNSDGTMKNNNDASLQIPYRLYQDATLSKEWGSVAENRFSQKGTGQAQKITIWGQVPDTNVPVGEYSDKVTATITY
ncbi:spore coat U domain-containing protein [Acinetobacter puyangensis]|uniref:Csu type fimbrial protein n=1 Tax=Acinetobacter puyangensis TaxID=1096779 RepID=UPI003A4E4DBD